MCRNDVSGRSTGSQKGLNLDVWGCSMQAAWDIVRPHGYLLLQYDWPDALFVHEAYAHMFPCLLRRHNMSDGYWIGYDHASKHYERFKAQ